MSEVGALALDTCTALRTCDDTGIAAPCTALKCGACICRSAAVTELVFLEKYHKNFKKKG